MNFKTLIISTVLTIFSLSIYAQSNALELEQVISITIENNLDLAIASNNELAANRLASRSQANYLPSINFNSSASYSNSNTKLEFAGGLDPVEVNGAVNTALAANIGLNYVIFNGFGRMHSYQSLMSSADLTEVQSRVLTENLILEAVNTFLDIQLLQLDIQAALENLAISNDRLARTKIAVEAGAKSKLDLLNAEVDLNNDSLTYKSLIVELSKQKASLNILMGREPEFEMELSSSTPVPILMNKAEILDFTLNNNASILLAQISKNLMQHSRGVIQSAQYPQLNLNASYGVQSSQNGAGIILSQNNVGFSGGLNLSIPIFNGNQLNTALKNADLNIENSEIELQKTILLLKNEVYAAILDESLLKSNIATLNQNVRLADAALKRAQLSYDAGQISANDLRFAQLNLLLTKNQLNQANMNLIRLYYALSRLVGSLTN